MHVLLSLLDEDLLQETNAEMGVDIIVLDMAFFSNPVNFLIHTQGRNKVETNRRINLLFLFLLFSLQSNVLQKTRRFVDELF